MAWTFDGNKRDKQLIKGITVDVQVKGNKNINATRLEHAVRLLAEKEVLVGVPDATAGRRAVKGSALSNATLAYIHNTGSPSQNIPARPFMEPGIEDARSKIVERLEHTGQEVMDSAGVGASEKVNKTLVAVGQEAQNAVRKRINDGNFAPLKPGTIRGRKRRGRTGTKPLIDTGQLRNSITFVVRNRKEK